MKNRDTKRGVLNTPLFLFNKLSRYNIKILLIGFLLFNSVSSFSKIRRPSDPFYRAVYSGNLEKIERLIKEGVSIEKKNGALIDINDEDIFNLLIESGADVNVKYKGGNTPLHLRSYEGYLTELLIKNGADVNAGNDEGNTPLHLVRRPPYRNKRPNQKRSVCNILIGPKLLIENGADVNAGNNEGNTPLHLKAGYFMPIITNFLIENGADVNARNNKGKTPLFYVRYNPEPTKILIKNGAKINIKDNIGKTPLHEILSWDKKISNLDVTRYTLKVIRLLIENGADMKIKDNKGKTPLDYAGFWTKWGIRFYLWTKKWSADSSRLGQYRAADIKTDNVSFDRENEEECRVSPPFYHAAYKGKLEKVKKFLKEGVSIEKKNEVLLIVRDENTFNLLIKNGADVNTKYKGGNTPLHLIYNVKTAGLLIKNGADVNAGNNEGNAPLHLKSSIEYFVKLLIDSGADVNARNNEGSAPLHLVSRPFNQKENIKGIIHPFIHLPYYNIFKQKENANLLIENGADVNARNKEGKTPLFYTRDKVVTEFLIENGADVNIKDKRGETPLHNLISFYFEEKNRTWWNMKKCFEITKIFIKNGADIKIKDNKGKTPLDYAGFWTRWKIRFYLWTN